MYQMGEFGGPNILVDWVPGDYKFNDRFGVRAGKIKIPLGLFNESQDIDSLFLWTLLPQANYPDDNRDFDLVVLGGEVYGWLGVGNMGSVQYRGYAGEARLDANGGYMRRVAFWSVVASVIVSLAATSIGQEKKEDKSQVKSDRLTAGDVFNIQSAVDPQISPDGRRVVYVRQFADIMNDKRESNLWVINVDGTEDRALTSGNYSDTSPRWSPDGTRIAYISDREGKPQIYVRWMDNGQTAELTNLETAPTEIVWSPDGKLISFSAMNGLSGGNV